MSCVDFNSIFYSNDIHRHWRWITPCLFTLCLLSSWILYKKKTGCCFCCCRWCWCLQLRRKQWCGPVQPSSGSCDANSWQPNKQSVLSATVTTLWVQVSVLRTDCKPCENRQVLSHWRVNGFTLSHWCLCPWTSPSVSNLILPPAIGGVLQVKSSLDPPLTRFFLIDAVEPGLTGPWLNITQNIWSYIRERWCQNMNRTTWPTFQLWIFNLNIYIYLFLFCVCVCSGVSLYHDVK